MYAQSYTTWTRIALNCAAQVVDRLPVRAVAACVLGAQVLAPIHARAVDHHWPARPIVMTVVAGPGSPPDVVARELAERIGPALGQKIVIENLVSAGGIIGMDQARRAAPDGYRFVLSHIGPLAISPSLFKSLPYDPVKDFEPVSLLLEGPMILVASPRLRVTTLHQLIEVARAKPGTLFFAATGIGTPSHIFFEQFKAASGVAIDIVPFRGATGMGQALESGDAALGMESYAFLMPLIEAGKAVPLAVSGEIRLAALPNVPTFAELGVANIGVSWIAVLAPKGTPRPIVDAMQRELAHALAEPDLRKSYEALGRHVIGSTPEELAARISDEIPRWHELIQRIGIQPQ